jgi:hypothetical protein
VLTPDHVKKPSTDITVTPEEGHSTSDPGNPDSTLNPPEKAQNAPTSEQSSAPEPTPEPKPEPEPISIEKPQESGLARFKTSRSPAERVEKLLAALPHGKISDAKDFVRLHPDEEAYWSDEYFFVVVPVQGQKEGTLHLISADLTEELPAGRVQRFRLALASKPHDVFFLVHVPSQNLDNEWNRSNLEACEKAKTSWLTAVSKKAEGKEGYHITKTKSESPFPEPSWPTESLDKIIETTFAGRMILERTDPAWHRLIGLNQKLS